MSGFRSYTSEHPCPICGGTGSGSSASRCHGFAVSTELIYCGVVKSDRPSKTGRTWRHDAPAGYVPPEPQKHGARRRAPSDHAEEGDFIGLTGLSPQDWQPQAVYTYTHPDTGKSFFVLRFPSSDGKSKAFRQARRGSYSRLAPDGEREPFESWKPGLRGLKPWLYRLAELRAARPCTVYVTEGEKDCDRIRKAGAVATTAPGGADKWSDTYSEELIGCDVTVIADRDANGRGQTHAYNVAASIRPHAASCVVLGAASGKDAFDHLAAGHTLDDLEPVPHPTDSAESLRNAIRSCGDALDYIAPCSEGFLVCCPLCASRLAVLTPDARLSCPDCNADHTARELLRAI